MLRPILSAYLSSPVQPTASPCLPGHRHPVKELHSVERRSSEVTVNLVTVDGPVYHVVSIYLCRAESISRFDDRYAKAKFLKSGVWDKVLEGSTLISGRYPSFLQRSAEKVKVSSHTKTDLIHLDLSVSTELRLVTDTDIGDS